MMKFLDLLKNRKSTEETDSYELFLSCIDELSQQRLRAIDMAVDIIRAEFLEEGFTLTETECYSPVVRLKRNQYGFYVDETKSLNSKEEYRNYLYGKEFLNNNKEIFKRLNQLLMEKEIIMRGSYNIVKGKTDELNELVKSLGYGVIRDRVIFEELPDHPSDEHIQLEILLDLANSDDVKSYNKIVEKAMKRLTECFSDDVSLEIKRLDDTYDRDFDHTFGILLVDKVLGDVSMLYYSDGITVRKSTYDKYLKVENPYLDIYMRIILKCLQKELSNVDNKKPKK